MQERIRIAQAAEQIIRNFASKAFRRPIADDEVVRLMEIWSKYDSRGESFEATIHTTLQAILVSPHFLYRYEKEPSTSDAGGVRTLDEYELAVLHPTRNAHEQRVVLRQVFEQ